MMDIEVPKTCWAYYKCNKPFSAIKLVFLLYAYATMHGQTHIKSSGFTIRLSVIIRQSVSECKFLKTWLTKGEELNVACIPLVWMSNGGHFLCCGSYVNSINIVIRAWDGQTYFISCRVGVPSMGYEVCTAVLINILLLSTTKQLLITIYQKT